MNSLRFLLSLSLVLCPFTSCRGKKGAPESSGKPTTTPAPIEAKDFRVTLDVTKNGENFVFTLKLKQAGNKGRVLHVENPEAGINLVYRYNSEEIRSYSQNSVSMGSFTGITLDPISEYFYQFEFIPRDDGSLYHEKWNEVLPIYEKNLEIWVCLHIRVADYGSKQCDVIPVNSNVIKIYFPYSTRVDSSPEKESFKNLNLPPLDFSTSSDGQSTR